MTRASLDKQPHEVAAMFDGVAANYDLTNDVISLGLDRLWRREVAKAVGARPAQKILDLAAGTATSSLPFAATGAYVVPCDFSLGMLREGRKRYPWLPLTAGDATKLPSGTVSSTPSPSPSGCATCRTRTARCVSCTG